MDEEHNFAKCLVKRALQRSPNEEVFIGISKVFKSKLDSEHFRKINNKNFGKGPYENLILDTKRLQIKYNALKKKWRDVKDRPKKGSGLAPTKTPDWYDNLDAVLGDTNSNLDEVISDPLDTSYARENYANDTEESSSDEGTNHLKDDQATQSECKSNTERD